ncbi:fimbrial protein [Providencia alcalifaciens]|uniref:fimbrial protein n=1 Tax=Providencia alcalifaciens TaxID=126385 RepID=UPI002B057157|nr:fimbrial protein [Providencia alcalifaciens]
MFKFKNLFCLSLLFFLSVTAFADGKFVTVRVNVLSGGCVLNDNEDIYVDFGDDIVIGQIESGKYTETIPYSLSCDSRFDELYIAFEGVKGETSNSLKVADTPGLNIKLYIDNKPMDIGSQYEIDNIQSLPSLTAELALANGIRPVGGEFSTAATLTVGYH